MIYPPIFYPPAFEKKEKKKRRPYLHSSGEVPPQSAPVSDRPS
jgi:hypothetical protein